MAVRLESVEDMGNKTVSVEKTRRKKLGSL
jgi:hypothetical protein